MKPVLIIAAVHQEVALLEQSLRQATPVIIHPFQAVQGMLGKLPVVICVGGAGKINAAVVTAVMIGHLRPRLVINTGCAGAYPGSGLAVGGLAVASDEILGDEGVAVSNGWLDLQEMGLPALAVGERCYYNEIPLSRHGAERAMQLADSHGVPLTRGRFLTVSTCSGTRQRGDQLVNRFGAIVESMEGAAVALTCLRYGVDCLEIRGISNLVEDRNMKAWDIPRAVDTAQRFVLKYLEELARPERPAVQDMAGSDL